MLFFRYALEHRSRFLQPNPRRPPHRGEGRPPGLPRLRMLRFRCSIWLICCDKHPVCALGAHHAPIDSPPPATGQSRLHRVPKVGAGFGSKRFDNQRVPPVTGSASTGPSRAGPAPFGRPTTPRSRGEAARDRLGTRRDSRLHQGLMLPVSAPWRRPPGPLAAPARDNPPRRGQGVASSAIRLGPEPGQRSSPRFASLGGGGLPRAEGDLAIGLPSQCRGCPDGGSRPANSLPSWATLADLRHAG